MKKKTGESVKRLELHRETLSVLQDPQLSAIDGQGYTSPYRPCYETGTNCNISFCICQ